MKKIAILHIAHWDQLRGGAETQLEYLFKYLQELGHEVHFIYPARNNKPIESKTSLFKEINHKKIPLLFGRYWFVHKAKLMAILSEINPDIIITRTFSSWSGIASEYANKNSIGHFHFIAMDTEIGKIGSAKPWRFFDMIESHFFKKTFLNGSRIICQKQSQKEMIERHFGLNADVLTQAALQNDVSAIKKNDKITIVWIANLKPLKRPEKFLEIAKAFEGSTEVEFLMIGGFQDASYKSLIDEHSQLKSFKFLGLLNNNEVNTVLDSAHILVNTSDHEGFSNTFVQAWLRKVVVLSINSDPDNILEKKGIGFQTSNVLNTIAKLRELISHPEKLEKMADNAFNYSQKNHTVENVYSKFNSFIN